MKIAYKIKALALLVVVAASATDVQASNGLGGFYVGGNFGGFMGTGKFTGTNGSNVNLILDSGQVSVAKPMLGIFFGYNHMVSSCLYFGGEMMFDGVLGGDTTVHTRGGGNITTVTTRLQRKGLGWGMIARAGYMVSANTAVFLGLGFKSTSWTLRSISTSNAGVDTPASKSNRSTKFHIQAGAEGNFNTSNVGWRLAYGFTPGRNVTITDFPAGHRYLVGNQPGIAKVNPNEHNITVGIFYRFK